MTPPRTALDAAKQVTPLDVIEEMERLCNAKPSLVSSLELLQGTIQHLEALLRIARAVIEFKCTKCGGSGKLTVQYLESSEDYPCPTCTPLMSALEGLRG